MNNKVVLRIIIDLDDGEALAELFGAEKELFVNNFPQVLMAHAVSSLAANFDLAIDIFDGCSIPVLIGHPRFWKEHCTESCAQRVW